jgi:hypothetical protein
MCFFRKNLILVKNLEGFLNRCWKKIFKKELLWKIYYKINGLIKLVIMIFISQNNPKMKFLLKKSNSMFYVGLENLN